MCSGRCGAATGRRRHSEPLRAASRSPLSRRGCGGRIQLGLRASPRPHGPLRRFCACRRSYSASSPGRGIGARGCWSFCVGVAWFGRRSQTHVLLLLLAIVPAVVAVVLDGCSGYFLASGSFCGFCRRVALLAGSAWPRSRLSPILFSLLGAICIWQSVRYFAHPREDWQAAADSIAASTAKGACLAVAPPRPGVALRILPPGTTGVRMRGSASRTPRRPWQADPTRRFANERRRSRSWGSQGYTCEPPFSPADPRCIPVGEWPISSWQVPSLRRRIGLRSGSDRVESAYRIVGSPASRRPRRCRQSRFGGCGQRRRSPAPAPLTRSARRNIIESNMKAAFIALALSLGILPAARAAIDGQWVADTPTGPSGPVPRAQKRRLPPHRLAVRAGQKTANPTMASSTAIRSLLKWRWTSRDSRSRCSTRANSPATSCT